MQETLGKKIDTLFKFRGIPQMLVLGGGHMNDEFGQNLVRLQVSIYALDKYLETTWDTRKSDLKLYWRDINDCLRAFGLKRTEIPQWRKQIELYQTHELELRDGRLPRRRSLKATYGAKSCDVTLMRRLIFREHPELNAQYRLPDWTSYDLITEIHDDVEDIFEDLTGFNGNRFLLSILSKGMLTAQTEFKHFVEEEAAEAHRRLEQSAGDHTAFLAKWTDTRAMQTLRLLERRMNQKKMSMVHTSALANKLGLHR